MQHAAMTCLFWSLVAGVAVAKPTPPTPNTRLLLVRNTLTALNHATITGNYTVLRDLGSSNFQARYKAADLAKMFEALRLRKIDLSSSLLHEPLLQETPVVDAVGRTRLVGRYATRRREITFKLIFSFERGGWTIDEIDLVLVDPHVRPQPALSAQSPPSMRQDATVRPATAEVPLRRLPPSGGRTANPLPDHSRSKIL